MRASLACARAASVQRLAVLAGAARKSWPSTEREALSRAIDSNFFMPARYLVRRIAISGRSGRARGEPDGTRKTNPWSREGMHGLFRRHQAAQPPSFD